METTLFDVHFMPEGSPTPDLIQKTTETVAHFIQWIATLVRRRNWFMLLVLSGVTLALLGGFLREQIDANLITEAVHGPFWASFWTVVVLLFIGALVVAVITMPSSTPVSDGSEPAARVIKGLRPFNREDAAVFSQLQREVSLRECCEVVTSDTYKFGILMGESGCGKTSFLQAGLWPRLTIPESCHHAVYIRFSDQEPITTVCKALAEQLEMPLEWLSDSSFSTLLEQASETAGKPIVLLFDQFEQFFVHNPRKAERSPFIQSLNDWYQEPDTTIRVLVSIRADLLHELYELLESLQFTLGPRDWFKLDRFTPEEATKILAVVAENENFAFDSRFVTEVVEEELAHRDSGTVSPVDLQVLSWMIAWQKGDELRAFNRIAFQKLGGVEGLLTRFLERTLEPRILANQRQAAIKTLQALTDLDRQVRSGVLTVADIQIKLKGTAQPREVEEAVTWLSRSDVRLITPQDKDGVLGYELAHERLIPALMRLAGKELTTADRANKLLDRRVNEWLGNQRSARYLLGWRELWLIQKQKPYLVWGTKRKQKERLVRLSQRRTYNFSAFLILAVLLSSTFYSWLYFTPAGQIQQVRWALTNRIERISLSDAVIASVANSFVKDKQYEKGMRLLQNRLGSEEGLAIALQEVTQTAVRTPDISLLPMVSEALSLFGTADYQSYMLRLLADAYGRLGRPDETRSFLDKALTIIPKISNLRNQSQALNTVAETYGQIGEKAEAEVVLEKTLSVASEIDNPYAQAEVLRLAAGTYSQLGESDNAQLTLEKALSVSTIVDRNRGISLNSEWRRVVEAAVQLRELNRAYSVLAKALSMTSAVEVINTYPQIEALALISEMYSQLGDFGKAQSVLEKSLGITPTVETDNTTSHSSALSAIARAAGELGEYDADRTQLVLEKLLNMSIEIDNDYSRNDMLSAIARTAGELGEYDADKAESVLEKLLGVVETVESDDSYAQSEAMSAVSETYSRLGKFKKAQSILEKALNMVVEIENSSSHNNALVSIANAASKLEGDGNAQSVLEKALDVVDKQLTVSRWSDDSMSANSFSSIVWAASQLEDIHAIENLLNQSRQVAEKRGASAILSQIAVSQAFYGDWKEALITLRTCLERDKMIALSEVLARHAEKRSPSLIDGPIVLSVGVVPKDNNKYEFSVTIQSPDEGCSRYANWWEVITEGGDLLYRKVLNEPHDFEYQFTTNATVEVSNSNQVVIVRAHFSDDVSAYLRRNNENERYTTQAMKGSVSRPSSFRQTRLPSQFAIRVERQGEQPQKCSLRKT